MNGRLLEVLSFRRLGIIAMARCCLKVVGFFIALLATRRAETCAMKNKHLSCYELCLASLSHKNVNLNGQLLRFLSTNFATVALLWRRVSSSRVTVSFNPDPPLPPPPTTRPFLNSQHGSQCPAAISWAVSSVAVVSCRLRRRRMFFSVSMAEKYLSQ